MGREIRRVPANWEHPKDDDGKYKPLLDEDFETKAREWLDNCIAWDNGTHEDAVEHKNDCPFFWQWGGDPPDENYCRPRFESAEWYQVYETVSEGTPVTPPFATKQELVNYLVQHGDFWDQRRGQGGWNREAAMQFVEREWAPSGMLVTSAGKTEYKTPRDGF